MASLDPHSPIPLYHQLAERLMQGIRAGDYPVGSRIPSEPELARTYGIGRPTVRQATGTLIRRRCLERRRGSGTFVVEPPQRADLFSLAGTMASFEKGGIQARTTLIQRPTRIEVPSSLENPFAGREATFLSRLSKVRGTPVLLEEIYLDPARFPGLGRIGVAGRSLAQLAEEHYHMRPTRAEQNFRVTSPGASRARLLEYPPGKALLLVRRELHFPRAQSAIFAELYCRTDRLVFSQTLEGIDHE